MILIKIRDWLAQHKTGSLTQIAHEFNIPESTMENMLEQWVLKGIITKQNYRCATNTPCGSESGCLGCFPQKEAKNILLYTWVDKI